MKVILFCQNNYAFGILNPIKEVLISKNYDYLWFVKEKIINDFPYKSDNFTHKISDLEAYNSDVIFVPGNEVPYYLRGLKTQIFHGLAGEKKGHFKVRHYFDLYLTQGPYFTKKFKKSKDKHKDFDVIETGWPKLDSYGKDKNQYKAYKNDLLKKHNAEKIILYAPTFSPKLTSAPYLINQIKTIANKNPNYLILIKFHPLMHLNLIETYKNLSNNHTNIIYQEEKNIIKYLLISDVLVSDTSSVIYEFLLLNKPVITFNNISKKIHWENSNNFNELESLIKSNLDKDPYASSRTYIFNEFHPYNDGKSAERMVDTVKEYIEKNGVPKRRKLPILRRMKIHKIFGKEQMKNKI